MNRKNHTLILLALLLTGALALSSCNKKEPESTAAPSESTETTAESEAPSEEKTTEESTEPEETTAETETETETETEDPAAAAFEKRFIVTDENGANVRQAPDTASEVIGMVPYLGGGDLKGREGDWLQVVSCGVEGYLYAPLAVTGEEAAAFAKQGVQWTARVLGESVNIREAASLDAGIIGNAGRDAEFAILGEEGEFFRIDYNGTPAYLSKTVCQDVYSLTGEAGAPESDPAAEEESTEGSSETESASSETESESASETPAPDESETPAETSAPETAAPSGNYSGAQPQAVIAGTNGLTVCIDAGHQQHGMSDPEPNGPGSTAMKAKLTTGTAGCVTGIPEYQTTLAVALQLQNELAARGYTVVMIRTSNDCPVSNAERAVIANESGSNAFIRIHCNSVTDPNVTGVISYAPAPGNPYMSADNVNNSINFSNVLTGKTAEATGAQNRGVIQDNTMTGINWSQVPVSIIEMGFSSNPTEDQLMNDPAYQAKLVQGMANGIDAFFGK